MYNLSISEFKKAKDGSLFVKKGDKLVAIDKEEFLKDLVSFKKDISKIKTDQESLNKMIKFFDLYSKPHFQVVFNAFIIEVLRGNIEVANTGILTVDKLVLDGTITVKEALEVHPFLKERFNELFVNNKKELKGFWEV